MAPRLKDSADTKRLQEEMTRVQNTMVALETVFVLLPREDPANKADMFAREIRNARLEALAAEAAKSHGKKIDAEFYFATELDMKGAEAAQKAAGAKHFTFAGRETEVAEDVRKAAIRLEQQRHERIKEEIPSFIEQLRKREAGEAQQGMTVDNETLGALAPLQHGPESQAGYLHPPYEGLRRSRKGV